MDYSQTYIDLMIDSLKEKMNILDELLTLSKKQGECIRGKQADTPAYDELYQKKDQLIQALLDLDAGFEKMFQRVKEELDQNREAYKDHIILMQNLIRQLTDKSVSLQAVELRNKDAMEQYLKGERETIRQFHNNSRASDLYYQNMPNRTQQIPSFFYDEKK